MIVFNKIRWKNLLSTGNAFTEIDLDKYRSTLIVGTNGSGKSTILDAFCFCLFNKAFRDINKADLINSINEKGLITECEFTVGDDLYLVKRGQKPNVFEIWCNGKLVEPTSVPGDYQEYLENHILGGLNIRTAKQIIFVGNATYIPFMQQTPAVRRDMVEDLLDIKVFTQMAVLLKDKLALSKNNLADAEMRINYSSQAIQVAKNALAQMEQDNQKDIEEKETKIIELEAKIFADKEAAQVAIDEGEKWLAMTKDMSKYQEKLRLIDIKEREFENEAKALEKDIAFFEKNLSCPTCKQEIDKEFSTNILQEKKDLLAANHINQEKLEEAQITFQKRLKEMNEFVAKSNVQQKIVSDKYAAIKLSEGLIKGLAADIVKLKTKKKDIDKGALEKAKEDLKKALADKEEAVREKDALDTVSALLKDGGIKTQIIKNHIPIINKLINKYLAAMDFFVNFEIDEQFNETIKSRHRDTFKYASFSEGEKAKIDLSFLFAWRAVAKMRNSLDTNILFLDEVFDGSLDANAGDELLKILNDIGEKTHVFVISHKNDSFVEKFYRTIKFEKHQSFSRMVEI